MLKLFFEDEHLLCVSCAHFDVKERWISRAAGIRLQHLSPGASGDAEPVRELIRTGRRIGEAEKKEPGEEKPLKPAVAWCLR